MCVHSAVQKQLRAQQITLLLEGARAGRETGDATARNASQEESRTRACPRFSW